MLHQLLRNPVRARECADASAEVAAEHGLSFWLAGSRIMSGWANYSVGNVLEGIDQLRQGLLDWQATGSVTYRTYYLGLLTEALGSTGQIEDAQSVLDEALTLVERTDERFYEAELYRLRGEVLLLGSREPADSAIASAEEAFRRAIAISRQRDAKWLQLRAAMSLSRLSRRVGILADSDRLLAETYRSFTQGLDAPDLREARILLGIAD
jgi:predicted ATPase